MSAMEEAAPAPAVLWKKEAITASGSFRYEATVFQQQQPDQHDLELLSESAIDPGYSFLYKVTVHFMIHNSDDSVDLSLRNGFYDRIMLCGGYYGSHGNLNLNSFSSMVPNIPPSLAKFIRFHIMRMLPISFVHSVYTAMSDYASNLLNGGSHQAMLCLRLHVVNLNAASEFDLGTAKLFAYFAHSPFIVYYSEESKFPLFDHKLLMESTRERDDDCSGCCSICSDDLHGTTTSKLPCSHIYHYDCILPLLFESNRCPVCDAAYNTIGHITPEPKPAAPLPPEGYSYAYRQKHNLVQD